MVPTSAGRTKAEVAVEIGRSPGFIRNSINRSDDWSPQVRALASIVEACGYALVLESADDRIVLDDGFLQLARNQPSVPPSFDAIIGASLGYP